MATKALPCLDPTFCILLGDSLSEKHSYVLADPSKLGRPLAYVSRGFTELTGYNAQECVGNKMLIQNSAADISKATGLSEEDARSRLDLMGRFTAAACRDAQNACTPEELHIALVVNRKKSGALFVCKFAVAALVHPILCQPYLVGCQYDVTEQITISSVLAAAADESSYVNFQAKCLASPASSAFVNDNISQFLHLKMEEVWYMEAENKLHRLQDLRRPHSSSERDPDSPKYDKASVVSFALTKTEFDPGPATMENATQTDDTDRESLSSSKSPRNRKPPILPQIQPSQLDGSWAFISSQKVPEPLPWLRFFNICGTHVTDGVKKTLCLVPNADGHMCLEGGVLSVENGILHRDGKSGIRLSYERVKPPHQRNVNKRRPSFERTLSK